MKAFSGFPARSKFTPIPNLFFSAVLPQIDDLAELKVTLHVFWAVYQKRGYPRFVTYRELLGDPEVTRGPGTEQARAEQLRRGLDLAAARGTLLHLPLEAPVRDRLLADAGKSTPYLGRPGRWGIGGAYDAAWRIVDNVPRQELMAKIQVV